MNLLQTRKPHTSLCLQLVTWFVLLLCPATGTARTLHRPALLADPLEPRMGLLNAPAENEWQGLIGARLPLIRDPGDSSHQQVYQMGLNAFSWTLLNRQGNKFPVRAVDYLFGVYGQINHPPWVFRLSLNHISAHLGDAFFRDQPPKRTPITYSREYVRLLLLRAWQTGESYLALNWVYHRIPEGRSIEGQWGFGWYWIDYGEGPYVAADLFISGERAYLARWNVQVGWAIPLGDNLPLVRVAALFRTGRRIFGQFFRESATRVSLGIYLDLP